MSIVVTVMWILYSIMEGRREAWYYHIKNLSEHEASKDIPNEHRLFTLQRATVLLALTWAYGANGQYPWYEYALLALSFCMMFPFLHDGEYYYRRNKLLPGLYPMEWNDQTKSSTARINIHPLVRAYWWFVGLSIVTSITFFLP